MPDNSDQLRHESEWEQHLLTNEVLPQWLAQHIVAMHKSIFVNLTMSGVLDTDHPAEKFGGDVEKMVQVAQWVGVHSALHHFSEHLLCLYEAGHMIQHLVSEAIATGELDAASPALPATIVETVHAQAVKLRSVHKFLAEVLPDYGADVEALMELHINFDKEA